MRKALFLTVLMIALAFNAQAASKIGTMGSPNSTGTYAMEAFDDRTIVVAPDAGLLMSYESATTVDTLTIADCGKTFLVTTAAPTIEFELPSASELAGCTYKFVAIDGAAANGKKVVLDPASTDMFRGVVNSLASTTFVAGDSVISPGNTNDTIAVISSGTTIWDVTNIRGTWTDGN